jgi:hypothetical protein
MLMRHPRTELDIPFRGDRNYVQFSDMFAALEQFARDRFSEHARLQKLELRRIASHKVEASRFSSPSAVGTFEIRNGRAVTMGWLVETGHAIERRIPYDEAPVIEAAIVEPGRAFLKAPIRGYTALDQAVILLKILGAQLNAGKCVVAKLDLSRSFREHLPVELNLLETILARSQIIAISQNLEAVARIQSVLRQEEAIHD